ncbi:aromatic ring-hydroxylating dioxygenase subunit alpha [Marinomonas rhizomae]|uniref:Rieske 2Fe-2S family protein n=1 Tax=Marinomonas rhizomae TaxID=491948 RepID=A0A366J2L9_9GAMM|nr:aromatic ring-hydroxylating dioxygenase subunit alpha [Marinomonas rhizomae]RBP80504.1 Rieske 2Fe-2S family protein [Marinomonas rhizomae]RNF71741.1 aromatic ring-hydroxylating dioxygenase subunit alpha [Marinomonas rhizomae]
MEHNIFTAKNYTDPAIFDLEMRKIFSQCWHFAGLVEDLSKNNHYLTVLAGYNNLVIVRNDHGQLNAFHNRCRHRGMKILEGSGEISHSHLSCPYHDWAYNWQGELKGLPQEKAQFKGLDKACLSLKPAKVSIWRGMLWVHPDQDATSLEDYFSGMPEHLAPYCVEELIEAKDEIFEVVITANWKLVVENYIDHYHLSQLHRGTLNMYDHKSAQFGFCGDHYYFWEPLSEEFRSNLATNSALPLLMDKNSPQLGTFVPMLFPSFGLAESESSWSIYQILPLEVNKTRVIIRNKVKNTSSLNFLSQAARSAKFWTSRIKPKDNSYPNKHPLGSADFMQEDIYVCEQLQKSLISPYFEFGPSAAHGEAPIRGFQERVLRWLNDG